jgi:hypothetical protein
LIGCVFAAFLAIGGTIKDGVDNEDTLEWSAAASGGYTFTITVSDGGESPSSAKFSLEITVVKPAPEAGDLSVDFQWHSFPDVSATMDATLVSNETPEGSTLTFEANSNSEDLTWETSCSKTHLC